MKVRKDRLTHGCGHKRYNAYVSSILECIKTEEELIVFREYQDLPRTYPVELDRPRRRHKMRVTLAMIPRGARRLKKDDFPTRK